MSRRAFVGAAGALTLAATVGSAVVATPALAADPASGTIPDPIALTGAWTRTASGGQRVVTGADSNALTLSEQLIESFARYRATVTIDPASPFGVGALVVRAAADGSSGYVAAIDPNLDRVRLFDLATGQDVVTPAAFTSQPGTTYLLEISLDGPALTVSVNGTAVLSAQDRRYQYGHAGLHAYNGTVTFGLPTLDAITTNLSGWGTDGGTWNPTILGWHATAPANVNCRALAATTAHDLTLGVDLRFHDQYAVAALLLRTDATGQSGYALQADPNLDRLRLYRIDGNVTLGTYSTPVNVGSVYRLRVEAEGGELRVYWQTDYIQPNGYAPVITAQDSTHASGRLGLQIYNGSASFENVSVSDVTTDLQGWTDVSGTWTPDLRGIRAQSSGTATRTAPFPGGDVMLSLDVTFGQSQPSAAGVLLRTDTAGAGGYEVRVDPVADQVTLRRRSDGAVLATAAAPVRPIGPGSAYRLEVQAVGTVLDVYLDGVRVVHATVVTAGAGRVGLTATGGVAYFQNIRVRSPHDWYTEPFRPGYHFSQLAEYASDPNGLVYYAGEYHLFHQDKGRWAHAVSTDLLTWRPLPIALPFSPWGQAWSGCAVADTSNVTGLFPGGSGLVAFYTSYHPDKSGGNQCVRAAYSTDKGRSWQWYGTAPVVQNPGGLNGNWDFRDPKVIWDQDHGKWLMVVSGADHVRFFTSTNLLDWTYVSSFGYGAWVTAGIWECPDFFPLLVDGNPANKRWVLFISTTPSTLTAGSSSVYFTGTWNGTTFTSDTPAGTDLRADSGRDHYAAVTYSQTPDGRRILHGWMSNWNYAFDEPTGAWRGTLGIPRELALTDVPGQGIRLTQTPVAELASLQGATTTVGPLTVTPNGPDPLAGQTGLTYEIEAVVSLPNTGAATEFGLRVRQSGSQRTVIGYDVAGSVLFADRTLSGRTDFTETFASRSNAALVPAVVSGERRITLRVLVDSCSVEAFGGNGQAPGYLAALTSLVFPDLSSRDMSFYAVGGSVVVQSLALRQLNSTTRVSDPVLPFTPPAGGEARGNLAPYTITPGGSWVVSGAGQTGSFDKDSHAISGQTLADLDLTTDIRTGGPDGTAGAAALVLRASADGRNGYFVNFDPDLRAVRLFAKTNGGFGDADVLANVPILIRHGATYPVRAVTTGSRIQVFLAGDLIIDVTDTRYGAGRVGLNVFGGRAAFQDAALH
ncbi:GH32 C-terminal domain-containing protein [Streptomyces sp.]|uniref:GH32 C-terminal domain-containing protein n=1 Tax=Streptomyces sp. TaxID=1931 RepID=UPI002F3EC967